MSASAARLDPRRLAAWRALRPLARVPGRAAAPAVGPRGRFRFLLQPAAAAADTIAHLMLAGILADSVSQWLIYGSSHPGAALEVGPVLIAVPYAVARALANRYTRLGAPHGP
jgi:hypothetical protein